MRWEKQYRAGMLEVFVTGEVHSVPAAHALLSDVATAVVETSVLGVCLDFRGASGALTNLGTVKMAVVMAAFQLAAPMALLVGPRHRDAARLFSQMAGCSGYTVEVFFESGEARQWLRAIANSRAPNVVPFRPESTLFSSRPL